MLRTIVFVLILFISILFLPFWIQVCLYFLAILFSKHRIIMLIPAIFADVWYAPYNYVSFATSKNFLIVLGMLLIYYLIIRTTRVKENYVFQKK